MKASSRLRKVGACVLLASTLTTGLVLGPASGTDGDSGPGRSAGAAGSFTTVFKSQLGIEGLTADEAGNLYVADRGGANPCRVHRVPASGGTAVVVGLVSAPCSPSGLTFDAVGRLYITGSGAQGDQIAVLTPDASSPPTATVFATGVPGANGVAFDRDGNLWTGDGGTGQGRVWRIPPTGGAGVEMFRVQPMANSAGVGRQAATLQPGAAPSPQGLVANGVAFTEDGDLLVADTARGAIWHVRLDRNGNVLSTTGCDATFTANTLCLDNLLVQHVYLEGADGIALDRAGNTWVAANERNAIVVVDRQGHVNEVFRNAADATTRLRNGGPLEFPTSPFLVGRTLCLTQSDGNRRDNSPNSAGEVGPGTGFAAKISCLQEPLQVPGLPLPVHG
jgi:sugar lactone lactonase YvrE